MRWMLEATGGVGGGGRGRLEDPYAKKFWGESERISDTRRDAL